MNLRHRRLLPALVPLLAALSAGAQAALISKENGSLVYDTNLNITWLADAGLAGGFLDWPAADTWAAGLTAAGIGGWRLPTADPGGAYYNATSELGQLFYGGIDSGLGGSAEVPITASHNANFDLFSNIAADGYWTGTAAEPGYAWTFSYYDGSQLAYDQTSQFGAWAVHDGDVPEPATVLLLALGAVGLFGRRRATRNTHASNPQ